MFGFGSSNKRKTKSKRRAPTAKKVKSKSTVKKSFGERLGLVPVKIKNHKDKKGGHPHVMLDKVDGKEVSVGITHDKYKGKNQKNYKCKVNPLGGTETSYLRRQGTVADSKEYYSNRAGNMHPDDYKQAKIFAERAKEKHMQKDIKKSNDSANTTK